MNTAKLKVGAVAVALLALVVVIVWQQSQAKKLIAEAVALREQLQQSTTLEQENRRLTEQLRLSAERSRAESSELLRLRAQATTARRLEQENVRLKAEQDKVAQRNTPPSQPADNPFDQNHGMGAAPRVSHAKYWGYALRNYAANHDGRYPLSFVEAASYLHDELSTEEKAKAIEAAARYELVYHGSQDYLDTLPSESTIIVREKEPWLDSQGRWCKAYCYSDGGAGIQNLRNKDFEAWEALRIPKPKQQ